MILFLAGCCGQQSGKDSPPVTAEVLTRETQVEKGPAVEKAVVKEAVPDEKSKILKYKETISRLINSKRYKEAEGFYRKLINSNLKDLDNDLQLVYFDAMFSFLHKNYEESMDLCSKILKLKPDFKKAMLLKQKAVVKVREMQEKQKADLHYKDLPVIKKVLGFKNYDCVMIWDREKIFSACDTAFFKKIMPDYAQTLQDTVGSLSKLISEWDGIQSGSVAVTAEDVAIFALCSSGDIQKETILKRLAGFSSEANVYEVNSGSGSPQLQIEQLRLAIVEKRNIAFGSSEVVENILFELGRNKEAFLDIKMEPEIFAFQAILNLSAGRFAFLAMDGILKVDVQKDTLTASFFSVKKDAESIQNAYTCFDAFILDILSEIDALKKGGIRAGGVELGKEYNVLVEVLKSRKKSIEKDGFRVTLSSGNKSMLDLLVLTLYSKKAKLDFYFNNRELEKCKRVLLQIDEGIQAYSRSKGFIPRSLSFVVDNDDLDEEVLSCPSGEPETYYIDEDDHAACKIHGSLEKPKYRQ